MVEAHFIAIRSGFAVTFSEEKGSAIWAWK
jgi:hypothetical protein